MNAMKCEDVEARIIDYLDKKLGEEESRAIESHIEKCERCLDDLNETQKLLSSMAGSEMEILFPRLKQKQNGTKQGHIINRLAAIITMIPPMAEYMANFTIGTLFMTHVALLRMAGISLRKRNGIY